MQNAICQNSYTLTTVCKACARELYGEQGAQGAQHKNYDELRPPKQLQTR